MRHLVMKWWALGLMLLTAVGITGGHTFAQGRAVGWGSPEFLGYGWWQSVTVDRTGTAHIGWYGSLRQSDSAVTEDLFYYAARSLDGTWTPATDVIYTGRGGYTVRNALAAGGDGTLYALLRRGTDHVFALAPSTEARNPAQWVTLTDFGTGYYLDLLADSAGVLHALSSSGVFVDGQSIEDNPCAFCGDLLYRRSTTGGQSWERVVNLTNSPEAGADRMDIYEGQSGRLYIDWDEGLDWYAGRGSARDVRIVYSEDNGLSWSEPIILAGESSAYKPIQIASTELADGALLAVWRYNTYLDDHIYYQISADRGQTWTVPAAVPGMRARDINDTPLDDYDLLTDNVGIGHLFAVGRTETDDAQAAASLFHVQFRQGQWRRPEIVYPGDRANRPEWPKAAIGPLNDIHLTWFIRYEPLETSNTAATKLQVFYSYRAPTLPDAPTQAFDPTSTPYPTATPDFASRPTATPYPTAEPLERVPRSTTNDLYAIETLLSALFICAVFCGGFYGLYRFWRR